MIDDVDMFICPACQGDLKVVEDGIQCFKCHHDYQIKDGIPLLFLPHEENSKKDVTKVVREFYEETPFPNYEEFENIGDLVQKAQKSLFARLLNEQIPFNLRVLEVGCGTGQLSNFLGVAQRKIFGTDMSFHSLRLGQEFKKKNNLERTGFYQMNLFRPLFKKESFPIVICNGVLHHTGDPFSGFKSISALVKKGGYILIGLYNKYGRLITDVRRIFFKISRNRFTSLLDPNLKTEGVGKIKKNAWFTDQYKNQHESKHTIGEVLQWFAKTGFEFVYGIPHPKAFEGFKLNDSIFKPHPKGTWADHFITQFHLMLSGSQEGGFFIMIGRKKTS